MNIYEKVIDYYYGEYKKGLFGKKNQIKLYIYPSHIEGKGFCIYDEDCFVTDFNIPFSMIREVFVETEDMEKVIKVKYRKDTVINQSNQEVILPGIDDINKWFGLLQTTYAQYKEYELSENNKKQLEKQRKIEEEIAAEKFFSECYSFHIKKETPVFPLFEGKNKTALIYIGEDKSLNFLKIDGYSTEEENGVIEYQNIHYYEKAGNIHYISEIHGNYASFGGSMTGGKFSKLAALGGGLLFGTMGMALGATLTYKPLQQKPVSINFQIDSDVKSIDERSVMLNFYSDTKKQYVDIELPKEVYNFLQTFLPEKKYGIVEEVEKKTALIQCVDMVKKGTLLNVTEKKETIGLENSEKSSTDEFRKKIEKLKMMKDAGLLTEEELADLKEKLLASI